MTKMVDLASIEPLCPATFILSKHCFIFSIRVFMSLGLGRWLLAGFIFAVLFAVLLYQLFAPGTELRYYRCRQGSIKGSEMWFTFTTYDVQVSCCL